MTSVVYNMRAIQARLGGLMGTFAAGTLRVRSEGPTGFVPAYSFAIPVARGALLDEGTVFVPSNRDTPDGSWPVTSSGTEVPVQALQGGPIGNQPPGTIYRWDDPLPGIEVTSVADNGLSGGVPSPAFAAPRQLIYYKQLSPGGLEDLFRAQAHHYPALVLCWERSAPLDGPMAAAPGPRAGRTGPGKRRYRHNWFIYVVTSRQDGEHKRSRESDTLRQDVMNWLTDAQKARGLWLSSAPGTEVLEATPFRVSPNVYVDLVRFQTIYTQRLVVDGEFNDWLRTRIRQDMPLGEDGEPLHVPDITVPMDLEAQGDESDE